MSELPESEIMQHLMLAHSKITAACERFNIGQHGAIVDTVQRYVTAIIGQRIPASVVQAWKNQLKRAIAAVPAAGDASSKGSAAATSAGPSNTAAAGPTAAPAASAPAQQQSAERSETAATQAEVEAAATLLQMHQPGMEPSPEAEETAGGAEAAEAAASAAAAEDFEEHGADMLKHLRDDNPAVYNALLSDVKKRKE